MNASVRNALSLAAALCDRHARTNHHDRAETRRRLSVGRVAVVLMLVPALVSGIFDHDPSIEAQTVNQWLQPAVNPLIGNRKFPFGFSTNLPVAIWNDPSVLKEGLVYSMWASLGAEARGVAIYKLASLNGRTWAVANNGNPVLDPGDQGNGDPDWFGVETPAVIKVGGD
jgi:hypothetical protein